MVYLGGVSRVLFSDLTSMSDKIDDLEYMVVCAGSRPGGRA